MPVYTEDFESLEETFDFTVRTVIAFVFAQVQAHTAHALNMHGMSAPRCLPGVCFPSAPTCRGRPRASVARVYAAKDVMCKDVVNVRKRSAASMEGQATIVFAGVEGQEKEVQCPKVCHAASSISIFICCAEHFGLISAWYMTGYIHFRRWCRSRLGAALHMQIRDLWV